MEEQYNCKVGEDDGKVIVGEEVHKETEEKYFVTGNEEEDKKSREDGEEAEEEEEEEVESDSDYSGYQFSEDEEEIIEDQQKQPPYLVLTPDQIFEKMISSIDEVNTVLHVSMRYQHRSVIPLSLPTFIFYPHSLSSSQLLMSEHCLLLVDGTQRDFLRGMLGCLSLLPLSPALSSHHLSLYSDYSFFLLFTGIMEVTRRLCLKKHISFFHRQRLLVVQLYITFITCAI